MTPVAPGQIRALNLIASGGDGRDLTPLGHSVINQNVKALLADGLIRYAHNQGGGHGLGYTLTAAGEAARRGPP